MASLPSALPYCQGHEAHTVFRYSILMLLMASWCDWQPFYQAALQMSARLQPV